MAPKAKISVILKADNTVVAQSDDAALWQYVFGEILGTSATPKIAKEYPEPSLHVASHPVGSPVAKFAKSLGLTEDVVAGALSPSLEAPYLHLGVHYWEAFKKNTPKRGPGSVSHIGFAGTALALWIREAKIEVPATQALATQILNTIGAKDPNASRGVKNTKWLQPRAGGTIIINPAEISQAQKVVKAFCVKKPVDSE